MKIFEKINSLPKKQIFLWLSLIALIYIQHRFWLFGTVYSNPTQFVPGNGDASYNLAAMMQSALNLISGEWFSLNTDHFTWWGKALGVTAHQTMFGLFFYILFQFTNNFGLIYNILQFSNLWLIQIGVFLLAKRFGANNYFAIVAALMIPLSQSYQTFYTAHIHASYYALLPYLILLLDIYLEKFDITKLKKALILTGLTLTGIFTILSDWHVFVFSSVFIGIYILFRSKYLIKNFKEHFKHFSLLLIPVFLVGLVAIPLVVNTLDASKTYNSVRQIGDVAGTNSTIESFLGFDSIVGPVVRSVGVRYPELGAEEFKLIDAGNIISSIRSTYPDPLYVFSFWLGLVIAIPWIIMLFRRKGDFFAREFAFFAIFFVSSIIILGPVLKFDNKTFSSIPLPYYILYKLYYPFQAIRAVWRAAFIGYIAILLIWSVVLTKLWRIASLKFTNINLKKLTIGYLTILLGFGLLLQNSGFIGGAAPAIQKDDELLGIFDKITQGSKTEMYVWQYSDQGFDNFTINVSYYNLLKKDRLVYWVMGGIHGAPPYESAMVSSMQQLNTNIVLIPELLRAKNVPFVIQVKNNIRFENEKLLLDAYYDMDSEGEKYVLWKIDQSSRKSLGKNDKSIAGSKYLGLGVEYHGFYNTENLSDEVYASGNNIDQTEYKVKLEKDGKTEFESSFKSGDPAFLLPKTGKSINFSFTARWLKTGNYEMKLYRENTFVTSKNVEVISNASYKDKVKELKKVPTELEKITNPTSPYNLIPRLTSPQKLSLKIKEGGIFNESNFGISPSQKITAKFQKDDIDDTFSFPDWLGQPSCPIEGDYFKDDQIDFWCNQSNPFDSNYNKTYPYLSKNP